MKAGGRTPAIKSHSYVVNAFDSDYRVFLDYLIIGNDVVSHDGVCR